MIQNKKSFFVGLLIAPLLTITLFGKLSAAQSANNVLLDNTNSSATPNLSAQPQPAQLSSNDKTFRCQNTIMQVIAHEDDDLLFMNPDLKHSLNAGACIKTIYLTAGDAGQPSEYWLQRERGAEAAYSQMLGASMDWQTNQIKINNSNVNLATLKDFPAVSLIFFRLPDGNLTGSGFAINNFQSLQKLEDGQIDKLTTVDGQTTYTIADIVNLLANIINIIQPDQIRTQANDYPDHSDHIATGRLVAQAYQLFGAENIATKTTTLSFYKGYSISSLPQNLNSDDLAQKQAAFFEYAKYDSAVCSTLVTCDNNSTYGYYLARQYQNLE